MQLAMHVESVNHEPAVGKGLVAGLIGGLVASWVMEEFQAVWLQASVAREKTQGNGSNGASASTAGRESASDAEQQEPATVKAARAISRNVFGHI